MIQWWLEWSCFYLVIVITVVIQWSNNNNDGNSSNYGVDDTWTSAAVLYYWSTNQTQKDQFCLERKKGVKNDHQICFFPASGRLCSSATNRNMEKLRSASVTIGEKCSTHKWSMEVQRESRFLRFEQKNEVDNLTETCDWWKVWQQWLMETICQFYISTLQCIAIQGQVVIELVPIEKWIRFTKV